MGARRVAPGLFLLDAHSADGPLSCWIGLDDSTRENGCVHYVPGSHRWNLLPVTGFADDMNAIQSVLTDEQRLSSSRCAIELQAGECSFHHPLMVHGSYENRSDARGVARSLMSFATAFVRLRTSRYWQAFRRSRRAKKSLGSSFRCCLIVQKSLNDWSASVPLASVVLRQPNTSSETLRCYGDKPKQRDRDS